MDCMIDIETLSTDYHALIVSIAAVRFESYNETFVPQSLILNIDISENVRINSETLDFQTIVESRNFKISPDTLKWWSTQHKDVFSNTFLSTPRYPLAEALDKLTTFCQGVQRFWSQGINFDPIVLEHAYQTVGLNPPWKYFEWMDSRSISRLVSFLPTRPQHAHDALVDCNYQISVVHHVYKKLNIKPDGNVWNCEICKYFNLKTKDFCSNCETEKPLKPGEWSCSVCKTHNFKNKTTCFRCTKPKE